MSPKDEWLQIRIDAELKDKAKEAAKKDGRSLSNWVLWLVQREIEKTTSDK